jgi:hypothetical protein
MAVSRYQKDIIVGTPQRLSTANSFLKLRDAVRAGRLQVSEITLAEGQRLDQLAGQYYGDGKYWWVIAAASEIGWWLQVPPGTRVLIPTDLSEALRST